jgi:hypothetical protein
LGNLPVITSVAKLAFAVIASKATQSLANSTSQQFATLRSQRLLFVSVIASKAKQSITLATFNSLLRSTRKDYLFFIFVMFVKTTITGHRERSDAICRKKRKPETDYLPVGRQASLCS